MRGDPGLPSAVLAPAGGPEDGFASGACWALSGLAQQRGPQWPPPWLPARTMWGAFRELGYTGFRALQGTPLCRQGHFSPCTWDAQALPVFCAWCHTPDRSRTRAPGATRSFCKEPASALPACVSGCSSSLPQASLPWGSQPWLSHPRSPPLPTGSVVPRTSLCRHHPHPHGTCRNQPASHAPAGSLGPRTVLHTST